MGSVLQSAAADKLSAHRHKTSTRAPFPSYIPPHFGRKHTAVMDPPNP